MKLTEEEEEVPMTAEEANRAYEELMLEGWPGWDGYRNGVYEMKARITEIEVPKGAKDVQTLDWRWFSWSPNLRRVKLSDDTFVLSDAFNGCARLEEVEFGAGVRSVGWQAFARCNSLEEVSVPDGVVDIGAKAFCRCESLRYVAVPRSVETVGKLAFAQCPALETVVFEGRTMPEIKAMRNYPWGLSQNARAIVPGRLLDEDMPARRTPGEEAAAWLAEFPRRGYMPRDLKSEIRKVEVPPTVKEIPMGFFSGAGLEEVSLPPGLKGIRVEAFRDCASLKEVEIPEGCETVGVQAFRGCGSLARAAVPGTVSEIQQDAFHGCGQLAEAELGKGVRDLAAGAFQGCRSLKEIELPDTVRRIGDRCFAGCSSLEDAVLPDGLRFVGDAAFRDCQSLQSAVFPRSVERIGAWAFDGCPNLDVVVFEGRTRPQIRAMRNYPWGLPECVFLAGVQNDEDEDEDDDSSEAVTLSTLSDEEIEALFDDLM